MFFFSRFTFSLSVGFSLFVSLSLSFAIYVYVAARIDQSSAHKHTFKCELDAEREQKKIIESISNQVKYLRGTRTHIYTHQFFFYYFEGGTTTTITQSKSIKQTIQIYCKILIEKNGFDRELKKKSGQNPSTDILVLFFIRIMLD